MYTNILKIQEETYNASTFLLKQSRQYLLPFLQKLDEQIDKRLVRTFYDVFMVVLTFRNRSMGLLLSELGGYLCGFAHAPAGTKRISNLLRSKKWFSDLIDTELFNNCKERINSMKPSGKRPLMIWDDSQIEKPESWFSQGLCSVVSSKGKRLTKIKKGFYKPPVHRICVPGFHWSAVLVSALGEMPSICQMSWWTSRGKFKELGSNIIYRMLKKIHQQIGRVTLNIFDRGYACFEMLEWLFHFEQDFLMRWKKNHLLINEKQEKKKTHWISRSYKGQSSRIVRDKERKNTKRITVAWAAVWHPDFMTEPLFLVIVRDKKNYSSPMYLLTNLPIKTKKQAWEICFSYFHRWSVEQAFRFEKSELAIESPRLWFWENRLKLLAIVSLVFDFLLKLLKNWIGWVRQLCRNWCHRTGNKYRKAGIPIYRLRMAIAHCLCSCFFLFLKEAMENQANQSKKPVAL